MALYQYACEKCNNTFDIIHPMADSPKVKCPECKSTAFKTFNQGAKGNSGKKEIWDYSDIRKVKPKWLKSRDGKTRVRYDPTKHGYGKGTG